MTKDFLLGLCIGILLALFVIWLFDRTPTDDDDTRARQGVPQRYPDNVTELEQKEA